MWNLDLEFPFPGEVPIEETELARPQGRRIRYFPAMRHAAMPHVAGFIACLVYLPYTLALLVEEPLAIWP